MSPMEMQGELFEELAYSETVDVEYKSARGGVPGSLWETYSAFANTAGGTLWLGVAQQGDTLDIHGVEHAEQRRAELWNALNNRQKVSRNLLRDADVTLVPTSHPGRPLIRLVVPRANRRERPVYVGNDPMRGTYRRNGEGDFLCREDEVRRMFADQSDEPADSRVLDGFGWDDIHGESLAQFRHRMASAKPGHPWLAEDDRKLLARLGGWRRDRLSGAEGPTVAGLLMFGREQAIRDPAGVPGYQLDYREHFTDEPGVRWTDRITLDGAWEGNLFQFYQRVWPKLSTGPGVTLPFQTDAEGYRRGMGPVTEALQEALVNALIHADYLGQGGIVIDRYPTRLTFSNPGSLLVSREQLRQGGVSECRNKSLQQMFQMLGAGDKAGSGIDRIMASWLAQRWQAPDLRENVRPDRVVLDLPMVAVLPDTVLAELRGRFGAAFDTLDHDEACALMTAHAEGQVTNARLQDMLSRHRVDITIMLRALVHRGLLVPEGMGRGTHYTLGASMANSMGGDAPPHLPDSPPHLPGSPPHLPGSPPHLASADPLSDPALLALAQAVRSKGKAPANVVRQTILALCAGRFLSLRELSLLLDRGPAGLRDRYVTPLEHEGLLELRYPAQRSHRDQAYRTVAKDTTP